MIRAYISAFSKNADSCQFGPYIWHDSLGQSKRYPLFMEGTAAAAYLVLDSARLDDPEDLYAALHVGCLERRIQLGLAESCTGGLVSSWITNNPGSSAYLYGGWVVYSNHAKYNWLQVSPHDLEQDGAVSSIIIEDMLQGIFANSPCNYGIAISGIAGPDGGSAAKPVGTVWIGVADKLGTRLLREFRFAGNRQAVRNAAVQVAALMLLELFWLMENQIDIS